MRRWIHFTDIVVHWSNESSICLLFTLLPMVVILHCYTAKQLIHCSPVFSDASHIWQMHSYLLKLNSNNSNCSPLLACDWSAGWLQYTCPSQNIEPHSENVLHNVHIERFFTFIVMQIHNILRCVLMFSPQQIRDSEMAVRVGWTKCLTCSDSTSFGMAACPWADFNFCPKLISRSAAL